jgi:hypothetical protein
MKKLLPLIGMALMLAFTLTGCELYFGKHNNGGDDDGRPPGWSCESNADCASGCYCSADSATGQSGECTEAGFCDTDADCPKGMTCDERNSCVPGGPTPCNTDYDCAAGSYCGPENTCVTSCVCETDAEAQANGFGHCDEGRKTCKPENAGGSCGREATSGTKPSCAEGSVPLVDANGAYTGSCSTLGNCDLQPPCAAFQYESDCLNPSDTGTCSAVYTGINCHKPDGSSCHDGDTDCTCQSFQFFACTGN